MTHDRRATKVIGAINKKRLEDKTKDDQNRTQDDVHLLFFK